MGLAAPKQRNKIGADPNNTKWAKSTDRFGHKILTAQGWKPGETLGAENASHASHYTAASSSHIRVLLREDGLGLGAKNGRQDADRFGLDMFQGLLGRLNGKSEEELQKEAGYRRDNNLRELVVKKFGGTTFVSGGFLVGDKIEKTGQPVSISTEEVPVRTKEKSSKKRKRSHGAEDTDNFSEVQKKSKLEKQGKDSRNVVVSKENGRSKKEKKQTVESEQHSVAEMEQQGSLQPAGDECDSEPIELLREKELKRQRKAEKKAAKEAKRLQKQERKRKRREEELKEEATTVSSTPMDTSETETCSDNPASGLQRTAAVPRGRFAVRSRYSQQKRLAVADPQALKEIFMIKAGA
ncbi:uncharacterized protein PV09_05551 [Verruconis gallopava]|uniref:PinX1-related protein 1 n=1 Tax=Verruconis gallopava TaxID=253628 RepID=A0A0D1XLN9_9PEZI|nr:uncharacterized protein PV09_05551 [Verruconis gallopava]KIW03341.1 hypothetical protein PV09_05551 [Verruconis gallopava]